MGCDVQKIGKDAEVRVVGAAQRLGIGARLATAEEDYAGKTDVVLDGGIAIQVSNQPKSKGQRENLERHGVQNVAAGPQVSDEQLDSKLKLILGW